MLPLWATVMPERRLSDRLKFSLVKDWHCINRRKTATVVDNSVKLPTSKYRESLSSLLLTPLICLNLTTLQEMEGNVISTLHQILSPFLLRRVKTDVAFHLPPKRELLVYAPLTDLQLKLYTATISRDFTCFNKLKEKVSYYLNIYRKQFLNLLFSYYELNPVVTYFISFINRSVTKICLSSSIFFLFKIIPNFYPLTGWTRWIWWQGTA